MNDKNMKIAGVLVILVGAALFLYGATLSQPRNAGAILNAPVVNAPYQNSQDQARITILYSSFTPQSVVVAPGSIVTWSNEDGVVHQIRIEGPQNFTSEYFGGRQAISYQFNQPGVYTFFETRYGSQVTVEV